MTRWLSVLLALVALGCSGPLPHEGRLEYDPSPEVAEATAVALGRLSLATGLPFEVRGDGTRVLARAPEEVAGGACANTAIGETSEGVMLAEIEVALPPPAGCFEDVSLTVLHEIVHSVRRGMDAGKDGHSAHGIFQRVANSNDSTLDESSLARVCEAVDCAVFETER